MSFSQALKSTNAPAKIATIMLALSVIARRILDASGDQQTFATECRVLWILSISGITSPHHLPKRLETAGQVLAYVEVYPGSGASEEMLPEVRRLVGELRAIVDEIQAVMASPAPVVETSPKLPAQASSRGGPLREAGKVPEVQVHRPNKGGAGAAQGRDSAS